MSLRRSSKRPQPDKRPQEADDQQRHRINVRRTFLIGGLVGGTISAAALTIAFPTLGVPISVGAATLGALHPLLKGQDTQKGVQGGALRRGENPPEDDA